MNASSAATPGGSSGASGSTGSGTGGSGSAGNPPEIIIQPQPFTSDSSWPSDLMLDRSKSNWEEWNRRLNLVVDQCLYSRYLDGSFICPDSALHPKANLIWKGNDRALHAFILEHVSNIDYGIASKFLVAHDTYEALRRNHKNLGYHAQVHIMKEALDVRVLLTPPINLSRSLDEIDRLHDRFIKMGQMDDDKLKIILIINSLDPLPQLQSTINELLQSSPTITSTDVKQCIIREEQLLIRREKMGIPLGSNPVENSPLAAVTHKSNPPICANCKRPNHRTEYCIAPGGQMAGKTIDEARAAQNTAHTRAGGSMGTRGNRGSAPTQGNTHATTPTTTAEPTNTNSKTIMVNGKCYMLVDSNTTPTANNETNSALAAISMAAYDEEEYITVIATDNPLASVDWRTHARSTVADIPANAAYSAGRSHIARANDLPFILDTGATCHISPEASDFKTLKRIPRHLVK
jgi:hypothetical protein